MRTVIDDCAFLYYIYIYIHATDELTQFNDCMLCYTKYYIFQNVDVYQDSGAQW